MSEPKPDLARIKAKLDRMSLDELRKLAVAARLLDVMNLERLSITELRALARALGEE